MFSQGLSGETGLFESIVCNAVLPGRDSTDSSFIGVNDSNGQSFDWSQNNGNPY
jgi:hypothetical protein